MLLELYIIILALDVIAFGIGFFKKNIWMWSISIVLSAILIFASYDIVQNAAVVVNQTSPSPGVIHYDYGIETNHIKDLTFSYIAIGLLFLAIVLFLSDIFTMFKEGKLGERKQ
jgi:hypothetical protein